MKIYNTMTRKKEEFIPLDENEIKIYVCGPTVYNYFHIGNARPFVVFDTLRRYLEYRGKNVKYVQNFTDVDDKIINKAKSEKALAHEVSEKYIEEYFKDAKALNVKKATVHPKVTDNIPEIIDFVKTLIDKGYAYESDGDVYYRSGKFSGYGKLSGQNIEELEAGARISIGEKKEEPIDFALWKKQKEEDELCWDSPWGKGRPGWHIECSVMSTKYLGDTIDIHAGGQDLIFPHHENEIAQSEAYTGKPLANYWMHNGFINIDNQKMSKSLNNFFTVRDILQNYSGEVIRYFLLSGHYRGPINFSDALMEQAKNSLARMQNAKKNLKHLVSCGQKGEAGGNKSNEKGDKTVASESSSKIASSEGAGGLMSEKEAQKLSEMGSYRNRFVAAMEDDLNTADAISAVFELITDINTSAKDGCSAGFAKGCLSLLDELTQVLGLLREQDDDEAIDPKIQALIDERQEARKAKNFARADEIRDLLKASGITLEDTPQGIRIVKDK